MSLGIPAVSIVMATYNRAHYILETLGSIRAQFFTDWECLIIDDGGTDNTEGILMPMLSKDPRLVYKRRPDSYQKGLPGCRNFGLDIARGDYIIFFDDDDIIHPMNLELVVAHLQNNQYSYCRYLRETFVGDFHYNFDMSKQYGTFEVNPSDLEKIIRGYIPFNSCAVLWKKICFKNNRFKEHLQYAEEWELYSRIISQGFSGLSINKCLFYGRKHANSNTGEFHSGNLKRRESKIDAILLIAENLAQKKMLTYSLKRYLVSMIRQFNDFTLFKRLMVSMNLRNVSLCRWHIFYLLLPLRLYITSKLKYFGKRST